MDVTSAFMDLKDVAYRAGLVFAAFLLAGIFAQQLLRLSSDADEGHIKGTVGSFKEALCLALSSDEGSSVVISFGMGAGPGEYALQLPDRLNGEGYCIEMLPGLMTLKWNGGRERVLEDRALVPCRPLENEGAMNISQLELLKDMVKGFRAVTPCRLQLTRPLSSHGALFVHVLQGDIEGPFKDLARLLDSSPSSYPGEKEQLVIKAEHGAVARERLLVFNGRGFDRSTTLGPIASFPFILPPGTSVETGGPPDLAPGSDIVVSRETVLRPDGNLTVLTRVHVSHPHGWRS